MKIRLFTVLFVLALLAGCSMPTTTVKTVDSRPGIFISGAPDDALLLLDGVKIGNALNYNGEPNILLVEPGTHRVVVQKGTTVIYDQMIFVDTETKRISVR